MKVCDAYYDMEHVAVGVDEMVKQTMRQCTPFIHKVLPCGWHSRNQSSTHAIFTRPSHVHMHEPVQAAGVKGPELGDCGDLISANLGMLRVASGAGWGLAGQGLSTALA
jgi:hypothetical protein